MKVAGLEFYHVCLLKVVNRGCQPFCKLSDEVAQKSRGKSKYNLCRTDDCHSVEYLNTVLR